MEIEKVLDGILRVCLIIGYVWCGTVNASASETFKIKTPVEIDDLFSAWVIKNHIDQQVIFVIEPVKTGSLSNQNSLKKNPLQSGLTGFEQLVLERRIQGSCINRLSEASRVLEVSSWRKSQYPQVLSLESKLRDFPLDILQVSDLTKIFNIIDQWCDA